MKTTLSYTSLVVFIVGFLLQAYCAISDTGLQSLLFVLCIYASAIYLKLMAVDIDED